MPRANRHRVAGQVWHTTEADGVSVLREADEVYRPVSRSKWAA